MWTSNTPSSLLIAASTVLLPALAQNSTNTTTPSCIGSTEIETKGLNSTGQRELTWNSTYPTGDPWYVTTLTRTRWHDGDASDITTLAYISVPENVPNNTEMCIYQFNNINATLEAASEENSCNGAISATCVDFLTDMLGTTNGNFCPDYSPVDQGDAFEKACPMLKGNRARSMSLSHLPGSS